MKRATSNQVSVIEADAVVATLNQARTALAEAKTIQETKKVHDAAAAAEIFARRQKLGEEASDLAQSIKVEALRKLGEMLAASPKAKGVRTVGGGTGAGGAVLEPPASGAPTLAELGLTKKESAVAQKLAALPEADFQHVREGTVTVAKAIAAVDATKSAVKKQERTPQPSANDQDGPSLDELIDELQKENESLQAQVKAMEADDLKAEALKWRKAYDHAVRQQSEAMDNAKRSQDREKWSRRQLMRCGKVLGEEDPDKIAPAVEAFVRQYRKAA